MARMSDAGNDLWMMSEPFGFQSLCKAITNRVEGIKGWDIPMTVSSPCCGLMGLNEMMKGSSREALLKEENVYDIDGALGRALAASAGTEASRNFHIGARIGDCMKVEVDDLIMTMGFVVGAPCPPWSPIGRKKGLADVRSNVSEKVIEWIVYMAQRGELLWFAMEQTLGVTHKKSGSDNSYADDIIQRFKESIPYFSVTLSKVSLMKIGVKTLRQRAWITGLRKDALCGKPMPKPISNFGVFPTVEDFLSDGIPNVNLDNMKFKRKANISFHVYRIKEAKQCGDVGDVAVFDVDRAEGKTFRPVMHWDAIPTLKTKGPDVIVASVDDIDRPIKERRVFRFLSDEERFRFAGHPAGKAKMFSTSRDRKRAAGNAYPVPMLAAVVIPLIERISEAGFLGQEAPKVVQKNMEQLQKIAELVEPDSQLELSSSDEAGVSTLPPRRIRWPYSDDDPASDADEVSETELGPEEDDGMNEDQDGYANTLITQQVAKGSLQRRMLVKATSNPGDPDNDPAKKQRRC